MACRSVVRVAARAPRVHYVDWLRVIAIAGVFLYHTTRAFDTSEWHVKNPETSATVDALQFVFVTFGIPVFFLLAGAAARSALRSRTVAMFVRERAARLVLPFAAGTLLLSPPQAVLEAMNHGTYVGPLPDFIGAWARGAVQDVVARGFSPTVFGAVGFHLWFLGFLFTIAVAALPLCVGLLSVRGSRLIAWLAAHSAWRGSALLFAVPIAVFIGAFAPLGTREHDWFEWGWYLAYYLAGFVLFSDERLIAAVRRDLRFAIVAAIASTAALAVIDVEAWAARFAEHGIDWTYPLMGLLFATEGWAWTVVVLNVGLRAQRFQLPVNAAIGDAVLPLYVLHQPVILGVAYVVVQLPLGILLKWLLVFGLSLPLTLGLVAFVLATPAARSLLGARPRPADALPAPA